MILFCQSNPQINRYMRFKMKHVIQPVHPPPIRCLFAFQEFSQSCPRNRDSCCRPDTRQLLLVRSSFLCAVSYYRCKCFRGGDLDANWPENTPFELHCSCRRSHGPNCSPQSTPFFYPVHYRTVITKSQSTVEIGNLKLTHRLSNARQWK